VTLQWSDPPFWGDRHDAGFVHRLAVRRSHTGSGRALLDWAEGQVAARGRSFVCLDTLSSNTRLRRYYEDMGFRAVGEITGPADHPTDPALGQWRATLYEKAALK
jgi:GNAT superfamily N-acetyltransferase